MYLDLKTVTSKIYGNTLVNILMDSIEYGQVNVLVDSSKYPKGQASFFIKNVGEFKKTGLPPMLDIEDTNMGEVTNVECRAKVLIWLKVEEAHYGVKPIVYAYTPYANRYLSHPDFADYKLWITRYTDAPEPLIPITWKAKGWYMWQFTSHDEVNAISGYVDADWMIGR